MNRRHIFAFVLLASVSTLAGCGALAKYGTPDVMTADETAAVAEAQSKIAADKAVIASVTSTADQVKAATAQVATLTAAVNTLTTQSQTAQALSGAKNLAGQAAPVVTAVDPATGGIAGLVYTGVIGLLGAGYGLYQNVVARQRAAAILAIHNSDNPVAQTQGAAALVTDTTLKKVITAVTG